MEFTITCPVDGPVAVSLEDIDSVVLRESERADVTFVCPHCGSEVSVTGVVPSFLLRAIEAIAEETGVSIGLYRTSETVADNEVPTVAAETRDNVEEAYCEYFRRQLARVDCVEDALAEIDAKIV